jgi:hypothetical protein
MKLAIRILAALLASSSPAVAEDWTSVTPDPTFSSAPIGFLGNYTDRPLRGGESIHVFCSEGTKAITPEKCDPTGINFSGQGHMISLTEFARSSSVTALGASVSALSARISGAEAQLVAIQNSVAGFEAFIPEALENTRRQADEGSAMAAAMTTVAPADGKANRIGFNTATYNGSTAVAVSYSRAAGDVDFNVGVAMAGDNAMVKAGAGFSW